VKPLGVAGVDPLCDRKDPVVLRFLLIVAKNLLCFRDERNTDAVGGLFHLVADAHPA
jgi:hypothetical protein